MTCHFSNLESVNVKPDLHSNEANGQTIRFEVIARVFFWLRLVIFVILNEILMFFLSSHKFF